MGKILVPTDFSPNSVAGLRFAIQLATRRKSELVFLHVSRLWIEDAVQPVQPGSPQDLSRQKLQKELESFVHEVYHSMNIKPTRYRCVIYYKFGVVNSLIDYAVENDCNYICISTHGARNVAKLFGTHTGELIKDSAVPILCIPKDYNGSAVTRILYASDLKNYEQELEKVVQFASTINAEIDMLHFFDTSVSYNEEHAKELKLEEKLKYKITFHHKIMDAKNKLPDELDRAVSEFSPSLLVMFTEQNRSFFELLFFSSKTEEYSFRTTVPLLVFNKSFDSH